MKGWFCVTVSVYAFQYANKDTVYIFVYVYVWAHSCVHMYAYMWGLYEPVLVYVW